MRSCDHFVISLIRYVIVDLLKAKWISYIKKSFFRQFFAFSIYFCISTVAFTLRHNQETMQDCPANATNATWSNMTEDLDPVTLLSTTLPDLDLDITESLLEVANRRWVSFALTSHLPAYSPPWRAA